MWKDWLYYTKGERRATITLSVIALALVLANVFWPDKTVEITDKSFAQKMEAFNKSFVRKDETKNALISFDPNTADSTVLINNGIHHKAVSTIIKYRNKGGKFKTKEDFFKIYGIDKGKYGHLESYIIIENPKNIETKSKFSANAKIQKASVRNNFSVEINSANEEELMKINGIGEKLSARIIKFRNLLGGFYCKEQIKEVYGISEEKYEQIHTQIHVDKSAITKKEAKDIAEKSFYHPYLNKEKLKTVREIYRNNKNISKTLLKETSIFTEEEIDKLSNYINISE